MSPILPSSDPLGSPHPLPWNWVMTTHATICQQQGGGGRHYQTPPLGSADGEYRAYSRIALRADPTLYRSRASSQLFVENCRTGNAQQIHATSPMAAATDAGVEEAELEGTIALSIPVSWSQNGDRLLIRHFEGLFGASEASDYAVIWDRRQSTAMTLAPNRLYHTHAILLGWSEIDPNRVLFRVGCLGKPDWHTYAVNLSGVTLDAEGDRAMVFGRS
ncbi:MAG: hypothetical protein D6728_13730 [Cyanobacteria bacterium J055]|nr:MAG: hypothetical protein D6728_13730 [Cyanobacteria bacterium J055]